MIVAIDGPAAAGKGTLARRLAEALDFAYLETGLLYRAVAGRLLAAGRSLDDHQVARRAATEVSASDLDADRLRDAAIGQGASKVAAIPAVRDALLAYQRGFGEAEGGAVLAGRDGRFSVRYRAGRARSITEIRTR